ncbi:hypothetical protein N8J89_33710 [Crossiella sp. CA-258035]|uniref:hypothetical protein n=1 Tax=Crossiella sp. CA-258035 TaxID=2981138 RepID=UPI0024BD001E|nr:hypothetical protein [Crossiella sp. CA-258035]WHT18033.1 hypothetical protein N8J89_33710 [Crossiella sp. CA-258035]
MTLRKVDEGWAGDDLDDLIAYFGADPDEVPAHQVVVARCARCAGRVFVLETDESSTCVRRTCVGCDSTVFMLDAAEYWPTTEEEAEARYFVECSCDEDRFEVAVGFTFYEDTPGSDIRWVSIAVRCLADGSLGYCASWKIGYGPSSHLVEAV